MLHRIGHIGRVVAPGDQRGSAIDQPVVDLPRFVVVAVGRIQDGA
jgi:hypothetical protein